MEVSILSNKILKTIQIKWKWHGDLYLLKGFNICLMPSGKNPVDHPDSIIVFNNVLPNAQTVNNEYVFSYNFTNQLLNQGATYVPWVQALYENSDSQWASMNGQVIEDDGNATIVVIGNPTFQQIVDMASDNKITPQEKVQLKKEWEEVVTEHQQIQIGVIKANILNTTEVNNYVIAVNALGKYLNYNTTYNFTEIMSSTFTYPKMLTDNKTTNLDAEHYGGKTNYNKIWRTYYEARITILEKIRDQLFENNKTEIDEWLGQNTLPDTIALGGYISSKFNPNMNWANTKTNGMIKVNNGTFVSTTGIKFTVTGDCAIRTGLDSNKGRSVYILFIGSNSARFSYVSNNDSKQFICAVHDKDNWYYYKEGQKISFTPNTEDCIVAKVDEYTSAETTTGIKAIKLFASNGDSIFNALTNGGAEQGIYKDPETGLIFVNAEYIATGKLKSTNNVSEFDLDNGTFRLGGTSDTNYRMKFDGKDLYFANGSIKWENLDSNAQESLRNVTVNIIGGIRSVIVSSSNAIQTTPTAYTAKVLLGSEDITKSCTLSWAASGIYTGSGTATTFTPSKGSYTPNESYVELTATYKGNQYKERIGIAVSKQGADGYVGADGRGIKSTNITYQAGSNGTTPPTNVWTASIPTVSAGQYLWTRVIVDYTDSTSTTSYSVGKMGEKGPTGSTGATGATGTGIESITELYKVLTTKDQQPTPTSDSGWSTSPPTWTSGSYIHSCFKIIYKNPTSTVYTKPSCDSSWEAVNEIKIGGRNLLLKSGVQTSNNSYGAATYYPSEILTAGETYTVSMCVTPASGVTHFAPYMSGGYAQQCTLSVSGTSRQIVSATFKASYSSGRVPTSATDSYAAICFYRFPNNSTVTANSTIHWVKVEKGNKASDWTPAPEDIDKEIGDVSSALGNLDKGIKDAFGDSIINDAEARAIEANIQILNNEQSDIEYEYNSIYNNSKLSGTAKTNLYSAKMMYGNAHTALINAINNAISDKKITDSERTNVNSNFNSYRQFLATYKQRIQEALDYISTKKVDDLDIGGRNLISSSNKFYGGSGASGITSTVNSDGTLSVTSTSGNGNWLTGWSVSYGVCEANMNEGDVFTISFTMKSSNTTSIPTIYIKSGMGYYAMKGTMSSNWSTVYYTGIWKKANSMALHLGFSGIVGKIDIKNWKIEKGNKPTDWCLSLEETVSSVSTMYYLSSSLVSQTGGEWKTTLPTKKEDYYIWTKTVTTYAAGNTSETTPMLYQPSWIQDWDGTQTSIGGTSVLSPKIFAGTKETNGAATGVAMGMDVFGAGANYSGIVGYNKGTKTFHFKTDGSLLIGKDTSGSHISWDGSNLKIKASSISLGAQNVATTNDVTNTVGSAIDSINIGGRNLALQTSFKGNVTQWTKHSGATIDTVSGKATLLGNGSTCYIMHTLQQLEPKTQYTFSAYFKNNNLVGGSVKLCVSLNNVWTNTTIPLTTNGDGVYSTTFTTLSTVTATKVSVDVVAGTSGSCNVWNIKVEKGNKATDWTPAPEDIDSSLSDLDSSLSDVNSSLSDLNSTVAGKVDKNKIIASINLTEETVKIQGSKIQLTGQLICDAVNGKTGTTTIDGGKITTGSISADKITITPAANNLLRNGAFLYSTTADPPDFWGAWGDCSRSFNTVTGKRWLNIYKSDTNPWRGISQLTDAGTYSTNTKYTISLLAMPYSATYYNKGVKIGVHLLDSSNNILEQYWNNESECSVGNSTTTPRLVKFTFTTGNNTSGVKFNVMIGGCEGANFDYRITDISMVKGDYAMQWTPHISEVYASKVSISDNGITIKNNAGTTVMSADGSGNLKLAGNITSSATISGGKLTGTTITGGTLQSTNGDMYFDMNNGYMLLYNNGTKIGQTQKNNLSGTSIYGVTNGAEYGSYSCLAAKTSSSASLYTVMVTAAGKDLTTYIKSGLNIGANVNCNNWGFNDPGSIKNPSNIRWENSSGKESRIYTLNNNLYIRCSNSASETVRITCDHSSEGHKAVAYFTYNPDGTGIDFWRKLNMNKWGITNAGAVTASVVSADDIEMAAPFAMLGENGEQIKYIATKSLIANTEYFGSGEVINGECIINLPDGILIGDRGYIVTLTPIGKKDIWIESKDYVSFTVKGEDCTFDYLIKAHSPSISLYKDSAGEASPDEGADPEDPKGTLILAE